MERVFEKVVRWLVFTVLLALVPIAFSIFRLSTRDGSIPLADSVGSVLSGGELLLIAAILCGGAAGELFGAGPRFRVLKVLSSGAAILLLLFSAMYFADVTAIRLSGGTLDNVLVQQTSVQVFFAAVVCSASCISLSELR